MQLRKWKRRKDRRQRKFYKEVSNMAMMKNNLLNMNCNKLWEVLSEKLIKIINFAALIF